MRTKIDLKNNKAYHETRDEERSMEKEEKMEHWQNTTTYNPPRATTSCSHHQENSRDMVKHHLLRSTEIECTFTTW
jgi:hypothetical protein